jgi:Patatin phospholipase
MLATLLEELPEEMKQKEEVKFLSSVAKHRAANIVQLIHRPKDYEGDSKDYEFSRRSMEEHWQGGYYDAERALRHPANFRAGDRAVRNVPHLRLRWGVAVGRHGRCRCESRATTPWRTANRLPPFGPSR